MNPVVSVLFDVFGAIALKTVAQGAATEVYVATSPTLANTLNGASCTSASRCTGVGVAVASTGNGQTLIELGNGSAWSRVPSPDA